ncbi:serine hydrolase domain-containing protein [Saccharomonospora viridis]|jgi:CubicO group peptidase (beta-lactamase class C family)|uniref:Penicillin-binding protein, beta-lactamase class C n=2 Tax=Saccharomonospora viridis TaxID=1852 RepID=C7MQM5_SACVD|nr:serine hydrolase domain-containing protein [Saccharomonospora viridis]ACU98552.1 penicillin-binding protein, beta-lactamase class C [Saccharomonospora viridis DSM 43017]KHF44346.1 beta-lactamase [Saccharomonospora viridis]SFP62378.1 CubicO group peptidase, beta-lactamase class C family [Saccharomonospora viridis]
MRARTTVSRIAALFAVLLVTGATAMAAGMSGSGRFDRPQQGFAPASTVLEAAAPEDVGLDPKPIREAERLLARMAESDYVDGHPLFAGAVGLLAHDGKVVDTFAVGSAVRYADGEGVELPADERVPMREDTIFDIASVTKLFTSIAVMQLVERGEVVLDRPVAAYLPEFGVNGKQDITVRQLLTHTSGLEPGLFLWRDWPDKQSRINAVLEVAPQHEPGTTYTYSDLNLITLGVLVERVTGDELDEVIAERITEPLGMKDTEFNPPAEKLDRIAATEFQEQPARGLVRGEVHDENAWSLGGVAGHAGLFSTARDLSVLGQALLNGGTYAGERILRPSTVLQLFTNYNSEFPDNSHGLGFELDQIWYMGGLTSPSTAGHTGYTGTSFVVDRQSRSIAVLLTNRVHPSRSWGSINPARQAWATGLARALAVEPKHGRRAWSSFVGDDSTATLTTPRLAPRGRGVTVTFDAFVNTEPSDVLTLEASVDHGRTWTTVPLRARGEGAPRGTVEGLSGTDHRAWWSVRATMPATDAVTLRWRFTTDGNYTARGVVVDGIRVNDARGTLLDGERQPQRFDAQGFVLTGR